MMRNQLLLFVVFSRALSLISCSLLFLLSNFASFVFPFVSSLVSGLLPLVFRSGFFSISLFVWVRYLPTLIFVVVLLSLNLFRSSLESVSIRSFAICLVDFVLDLGGSLQAFASPLNIPFSFLYESWLRLELGLV